MAGEDTEVTAEDTEVGEVGVDGVAREDTGAAEAGVVEDMAVGVAGVDIGVDVSPVFHPRVTSSLSTRFGPMNFFLRYVKLFDSFVSFVSFQ